MSTTIRQLPKSTMSKFLLSEDNGAVDLTLNSILKNPDSTTGWILYNDEMPASADRKDNGNLGHTKGVLAFDTATKTALWLLHSWPKFADPGSAGMPTPMYGQTYLCISLDIATLSKVAAQMANHQQPQTYLAHMPASLDKSDPLYRLTQPLESKPAGDANVIDLKSRGGLAFKVIAKNRQWGKGLLERSGRADAQGRYGCGNLDSRIHSAHDR